MENSITHPMISYILIGNLIAHIFFLDKKIVTFAVHNSANSWNFLMKFRGDFLYDILRLIV